MEVPCVLRRQGILMEGVVNELWSSRSRTYVECSDTSAEKTDNAASMQTCKIEGFDDEWFMDFSCEPHSQLKRISIRWLLWNSVSFRSTCHQSTAHRQDETDCCFEKYLMEVDSVLMRVNVLARNLLSEGVLVCIIMDVPPKQSQQHLELIYREEHNQRVNRVSRFLFTVPEKIFRKGKHPKTKCTEPQNTF